MAPAAGERLRVSAYGLAVDLPPRWEARIYRRSMPDESVDPAGRGLMSLVSHPAAHGWPGESPNPVLHAANFALPAGRGDFGTGAVEQMGSPHAFVSLLEYDTDEAGTALFTGPRPRLAVRDFAPNALQRRIRGQLGCQRFFTENGRPFCLYVVLGSLSRAASLLTEVQELLAGVEVTRR